MGSRGEQRVQCRAGQGGLTLIEVLIGVVVLGILMTSSSVGVVTLLRTSANTNFQAKSDALLTGFSEALKQLDYRPCATPADYEDAFDVYEASLPASERLRVEGGTVEITSVDAGARCDDGIDAGTQVINMSAAVRDRTRAAQIVKRNPDASPKGPTAVIDAPDPQSNAGDLLYTVALTARGSNVPRGVLMVQWDCGPDAFTDALRPREFTTTLLDDPAVLCTFRAGSNVTVTLTVTDVELASDTATRVIAVPPASDSRGAPTATITYTQTSSSGIAGSTNHNPSTVEFNGSGSYASDGSDLTYKWTFGDTSSGALNTSTDVRPTHLYASAAGSPYTVTLTVTDDFGTTNSATVTITVLPASQPPTALFTATPPSGVGQQLVSFDASASHNAANGPVASYAWTFGDGNIASGVDPQHRFNPGTYTVTLTVTDGAGNVASTAKVLTFNVLQQPTAFTMYDAEGELFDHGRFYFAWVNTGGSPGDTISYEIRIWAEFGCLAFGDKTRTVAASGGSGTTQNYVWVQNWPASNVCLGSTYGYRVRTKRVSPTEGTSYSAWSSPAQFKYVSHP